MFRKNSKRAQNRRFVFSRWNVIRWVVCFVEGDGFTSVHHENTRELHSICNSYHFSIRFITFSALDEMVKTCTTECRRKLKMKRKSPHSMGVCVFKHIVKLECGRSILKTFQRNVWTKTLLRKRNGNPRSVLRELHSTRKRQARTKT